MQEEHEMRQLLESINLINKAQAEGERCFESHIVFDGGVKQRELSEFALVLVSLLESTLGKDMRTRGQGMRSTYAIARR